MSRPKLGQLLLSENACDRDALMRAWEQKVLFGDRLGTNLLAGGHVDEETLALTLGRQQGVRAAYGEVLQPDPRVIRGLSHIIAKRHSVVPHHRDEVGVYLLMTDPHDVTAQKDVAAAFGSPVIPVLVCEARMWTLLNAHYGVEMGLRPIDLDGATAALKRLQHDRGDIDRGTPAIDLVSEEDFHALYQNKEEIPGHDVDIDVPVAMGAELSPSSAETATNVGVGSPGGFDEDTEVFQLTASMETEHPFSDLLEQSKKPPESEEGEVADVQTIAMGPSLVDRGATGTPNPPPVTPKELGRTQSASRIEFDVEDAGEAALAVVSAAGEKLEVPQRPAHDVVQAALRPWLSAPVAPEEIFEEALEDALDDALGGSGGALESATHASALFGAEENDAPLTFDEASAALAHVHNRSEIARIVIRYALTRFKRAALLTVHPGNILGWEGIGEGLSTARLSTFRLRRREESVFALVAATKAPYMGPLQRWPGNGFWVKHTGRQIPQTVAVFPILVRGEVVNLFYGDNGHQTEASGDVGELLILMQKISSSYEALLGPSR